MIASLHHRFIFLHLPKNAGKEVTRSIQEAFASDDSIVLGWGIENGVDLAHPLAARLIDHFPTVHEMIAEDATKVIALVRDPFSRCLAAFREHRAQYWNHPAGCETLSGYLDRIEACCYRDEGGDGHVFIHGAPQCEFLLDGDRMIATDVLRLDDALFYHKLCLLVGADLAPIPPESAALMNRAHVPAALVKRILQIYKRDYELMDERDSQP